jgi:sec-independent protein translocase protein TatC
LPPETAEQLNAQFSPTVRELADIVPLLHAAALLPPESQANWLSTAVPEDAREKALALHASGAELKEGQGRAALKLMGAFRPGEAFMLSLQLSFFCGLIISFPLLMYFLLQFIMPGLLADEKRLLFKSVGFGVGLFLLGSAFAYFAVLPRVLSFFYDYSLGMGIENDWRIGYYLTFAAKLVFVFGAVFELPVIIIPLIKLGILNYPRMRVTRGYALIGCFGAALFLAPAPDPATMFIMALPMYGLYELCIIFAWLEQRKQRTTPHDSHES